MSFLVDYGKFFRMAFSQNISRRLFGSLRYGTHPTSFVGHRFWILYQIDVKLKRASFKDNLRNYEAASAVFVGGFCNINYYCTLLFSSFSKIYFYQCYQSTRETTDILLFILKREFKELCNIWYNYFESKIKPSSREICFGSVSQKSRQNLPLPSALWKKQKKTSNQHLIKYLCELSHSFVISCNF